MRHGSITIIIIITFTEYVRLELNSDARVTFERQGR